MTYLQLINKVLTRLREAQVATVTENAYSTLIGEFVNEAKRQVENAWTWDALYVSLTITTVAGVSSYTMTGSGRRFSDMVVNNSTSKYQLRNMSIKYIEDQQQLSTMTNSSPMGYATNGDNGTDTYLELYPTPNGTYVLRVNLCVPQVDLSAAADVLMIQPEAVIACAYARALVERGEDGGLASSEAYGLYRGILADMISIDMAHDQTVDSWDAV